MSVRVAVYARYSSDLQNSSSIDDQIALCREIIERQFNGIEPTAIYSDAAITGSTMTRPGLQQMLEAADRKEFDVLVTEGLDRVSRNLSDIASIHQILEHCGVRIFTNHEGEVSQLHIGFKGTMNALFLRDMKDKVRRSHKAIAASGRTAAGKAYGYRVVRGVVDDNGKYVNGLREIVPEQAEIVRRIFTEYADSIPVQQIIKSLNDEKIPSPAGRQWRPHSISGEGSRYKGILYNDLYRGMLVYNRMKKVLDPRTGRRKCVLNPKSEWVITPAPHLRIVSDALWNRAQTQKNIKKQVRRTIVRRDKKEAKPQPSQKTTKKGRPLTGLVKCGWCGGIKNIANAKRYVCVIYRTSRRCKNARGLSEDYLKAVTLAEIDVFIDDIDDWEEILRPSLQRKLTARQKLKTELDDIEKRLARLYEAVERGLRLDDERIRTMEERREHIHSLKDIPTELTDTEVRHCFKETVAAIKQEWYNPKYAAPVRTLLGFMVDKIICTPVKNQRSGETVYVQLKPTREWTELLLHAYSHSPQAKARPAGRASQTIEPGAGQIR